MKTRVLLVGSETHTAGAAAAARQAGLEPMVHPDAGRGPDALAEAARAAGVAGIYSADEAHAELVAAAAHALGLPCFSARAARLLRNKEALRAVLAKDTELNPRYGVADTLAAALSALERLGLPAVVKPVDGSGGRGALIVRDMDDASLAFVRASRAASNGRVLMEPHLAGTEYRVVCQSGEGSWAILAVLSNVPAGRDHLFDRAVVAPVRVAGALRTRLREQVRTAMRLAGGFQGVVVFEFLAVGEALHLLEIAHINETPALATRLFPAICGINLLELDVASSVGRPFETKPRFTACGALWWLKPQSGIVVSVHGIVEARAVPGVAAIEVSAKVGTVLGHQVDAPSRDAAGYVLATARTPRRALEKAQYASEYLRFETSAALET
ncbi:MAG TPA: ATP-grasp domain-containing protein [Candidatus Hydrogenedentes bacterium]|nr:ATP-grasp domain-containing protein [Candidatus Hydrogenedentota bacterium]HQH68788.1 ATP-grasp domain-containing protein [Candidatus Hydrogenedentota bacterium]